jgi:hypothetical protein
LQNAFCNPFLARRPKGGDSISSALKINIAPDEIIRAIKSLGKKERDAVLEDLLAATSPEYLLSIREAMADYRAKRVKRHKEVFGG